MSSFNYDLSRWDVTSGDDMHGIFLGANTYETGLFRAAAPVAAVSAMLLLAATFKFKYC